ncbi:MAG: hypothetical protein ABI467_32775 [Kofleriaceae bacterium]
MTTTRQLFTSQMPSNARRTRLCGARLELELVECARADPAVRARIAAITPNAKIPVRVEGDFVRGLAADALSLADDGLGATPLHAERALYPMQPYEHLHAHVARIRETPAWRSTEA